MSDQGRALQRRIEQLEAAFRPGHREQVRAATAAWKAVPDLLTADPDDPAVCAGIDPGPKQVGYLRALLDGGLS